MISVILLPSLRNAAMQGCRGVVFLFQSRDLLQGLTKFTRRNWLSWPFMLFIESWYQDKLFSHRNGSHSAYPPPQFKSAFFSSSPSARVEVRALHMLTKHVLYIYKPSDHGLLLNNRPSSLPAVLQSSHPGKTGVI